MTSQNRKQYDITIRRMTFQDYDAVIALWKKGKIPYRPQGRDSKKNIKLQLQQSTSLYFLAESRGEIVGVVFGTHDGRKGWINRLVVTPAYQKKGIAKQLVHEVETRLEAFGIHIVASLIEDWNVTSMEVFDHLGYTKHTDIFYFSKRKNKKI
jgi:ribosomal protein S18 acetylase RimI-like enzyme